MNFMHPRATLVNAYVGPFADDFPGATLARKQL